MTEPSAVSEPGSALYRHDPFGITFTGSSDWHCKCGAFGNAGWPGYAHHLHDEARAEADRELLRYREVLSALWDEAILIPDQVRPAHLTECLQDADALLSDPSAANDAEARIVEPWRKTLAELTRAAAEYANSTNGISGDLGARLSDARALLADSNKPAANDSKVSHRASQRDGGKPRILADDVVCACLDETGERHVVLYERCLRCDAFMEADYEEVVLDWLDSEVAVGMLAEALERQHEEFLAQPESFDNPHAIAEFLVSRVRQRLQP